MEHFETILHSFANLSILLFEYIGVIVITFAGIQGLVNYIRREPKTRLILAKGLAMGLEFKLGSEILRTVIIRNLGEIYIVAGIIVLRAVLTFLIHWEIKNEEKEEELHKSDTAAIANMTGAETSDEVSPETAGSVKNTGSEPFVDAANDTGSESSVDTADNTGSELSTDTAKDAGSEPSVDAADHTASELSTDTANDAGSEPSVDTADNTGSESSADAVTDEKDSDNAPSITEEAVSADIPEPSVDEAADEVSEMEAALDAAVKSASKN